MAQEKESRTSFELSIPGDPGPLFTYVYDRRGSLVERAAVEKGTVSLASSAAALLEGRVIIAPDAGERPSLKRLERIGGYEPLVGLHEIPDVIEIPPPIVEVWPLCFCQVKGRVVRSDGRPICDARVHICEVDHIPWIIAKLPELEVLKLRDDLIEILRKPPFPPEPIPGPDPAPFRFRVTERAPVPEAIRPTLNPQPEVPSSKLSLVQPVVLQQLLSLSPTVVRAALVENYQLILPYLCYWRWWWGWFDCDEIAVVDTDSDGRFQAWFIHDCSDQPDLFFWVEFDLGSGYETVYHPPFACDTHWDYVCGTEVSITVTDSRVPACDDSTAVGSQVNVLSMGRTVAVREIENDAGGSASEGLTQTGQPFGGKLEPRVDFGPDLIGKGIEYYRWSYQRLSGPDGVTTTLDPSSEPTGVVTPLTRDVIRHYREVSGAGTSYPAYLLGPLPTSVAPAPNLFQIRPELTPEGDHEWRVLDEREDLASGHFETTKLAGTAAGGIDLAAGRYELRLELFDSAGALVNWTDEGVDLGITDQNAPFGTQTVTISSAPNYNRILDGSGKTRGFRTVLRVDNNGCVAVVHPVGGDITPDPACGFHEYASPSDDVSLSFEASHPNDLGTYDFDVVRGATSHVAAAETSGQTGAGGYDGFSNLGGSTYGKDVSVSALVGPCPSAAFAETLRVRATAQNGYSRIASYDAFDSAGFALTPAETD